MADSSGFPIIASETLHHVQDFIGPEALEIFFVWAATKLSFTLADLTDHWLPMIQSRDNRKEEGESLKFLQELLNSSLLVRCNSDAYQLRETLYENNPELLIARRAALIGSLTTSRHLLKEVLDDFLIFQEQKMNNDPQAIVEDYTQGFRQQETMNELFAHIQSLLEQFEILDECERRRARSPPPNPRKLLNPPNLIVVNKPSLSLQTESKKEDEPTFKILHKPSLIEMSANPKISFTNSEDQLQAENDDNTSQTKIVHNPTLFVPTSNTIGSFTEMSPFSPGLKIITNHNLNPTSQNQPMSPRLERTPIPIKTEVNTVHPYGIPGIPIYPHSPNTLNNHGRISPRGTPTTFHQSHTKFKPSTPHSLPQPPIETNTHLTFQPSIFSSVEPALGFRESSSEPSTPRNIRQPPASFDSFPKRHHSHEELKSSSRDKFSHHHDPPAEYSHEFQPQPNSRDRYRRPASDNISPRGRLPASLVATRGRSVSSSPSFRTFDQKERVNRPPNPPPDET